MLDAEKGITFEVSDGTDGELFIKALNIASNNVYSNKIYLEFPTISAGEYAEVLSVYMDNDGNKAVVPQGWTVSGVPKENIIWGKDMGLVIYHIPKEKVSSINWENPDEVEKLMRTYDQFVWTPVILLTANGTLDGVHFDQRFGRMDYQSNECSKSEYHVPLDYELMMQRKSVNKYGGYYSSRYDISKDEETGKPRSVKGVYPWTDIEYSIAKDVASAMVKSEAVTSHLMYGAEYDTREKWVIETGTVTINDIVEDSTELGNYDNNENYPSGIVKTGEDGCINNIYGFAGNVRELTNEKDIHKNYDDVAIRGGSFVTDGLSFNVDSRLYIFDGGNSETNGFRVTMCIK